MPRMGPYKPVDPPATTPPLHGLIPSATPVVESDDRWEIGYAFVSEACMDVFAWAPYCSLTAKPSRADAENAGGLVEWTPFELYTFFECSTAGSPSRDDRGRVTRQLEAGTSKALEDELWTGSLGIDNYSLVAMPNVDGRGASACEGVLNPGGPSAPTPVSPEYALAALGQALANCSAGSRGMFHVPVFLAELWAARGYIIEDGPRLRTRVRGDIVVAGSGYPGTGPTDSSKATPDDGTIWAFATGMVQTRVSDIRLVPDEEAQAIDRHLNDVAWIAARTASAAVDPCARFAILVDLP